MLKIERTYVTETYSVTLEQLKEHLRITSEDFDNHLTVLLKAAFSAAENVTGQTFIGSHYDISGEFTPIVKTGIMPIASVDYVVVDGEKLLPESIKIEGSTIVLPDNLSGRNMRIRLYAGYLDFPYDVRAAILLIAAKLFENPSDPVEQLPKASDNLLRPYKRWGR